MISNVYESLKYLICRMKFFRIKNVVTFNFVIVKAWRLYLLSNLDAEQHVEQKIYCCIGMIMSITIISKYDTNGSFSLFILSSYTGKTSYITKRARDKRDRIHHVNFNVI